MLDNSDVDLFLDEVEEGQRGAPAVEAGASPEPQAEGHGLEHFMAFLSKRKKKASRSKRNIALERYELQKLACPSTTEKEIADLAKFNKVA